MGTYYTTGASKKDIIAECTQDWTNEEKKTSGRVLAKRCDGNELWVVWEKTEPMETPERFIVLYLLSSYQGDWGYKPMDESMGPYYYKCPKRFLEMTTPFDAEWRRKVLDYWKHHESYKKIVIGAIVTLKDYVINGVSIPYVVISHNQRGWIGMNEGNYYRIKPKHIIC